MQTNFRTILKKRDTTSYSLKNTCKRYYIRTIRIFSKALFFYTYLCIPSFALFFYTIFVSLPLHFFLYVSCEATFAQTHDCAYPVSLRTDTYSLEKKGYLSLLFKGVSVRSKGYGIRAIMGLCIYNLFFFERIPHFLKGYEGIRRDTKGYEGIHTFMQIY